MNSRDGQQFEILHDRPQKANELAGDCDDGDLRAAAPLANGDVVIAGGYDDANQNPAGVWRFAYR